jgi:hypothetical protein
MENRKSKLAERAGDRRAADAQVKSQQALFSIF